MDKPPYMALVVTANGRFEPQVASTASLWDALGMALIKVYAQLNCTDIKSSAQWYQKLFGRRSDVNPMDGLKEWHHGSDAGFQLACMPDGAGHGSITLIVSDLASEHGRLVKAGLNVGEIVVGDFASFAQLSDPDGNTVILAEPR